MKILCLVNHFFCEEVKYHYAYSKKYKSVGGNPVQRKLIVENTIKALKDIPGCDVVVCGMPDRSLVKVDKVFSGFPPLNLIHETLNYMRGFIGQYDYFLNIEDDILVTEDVIKNIIEFDKQAALNEVFLPNRVEKKEDGDWFCVDTVAKLGWTNLQRDYKSYSLRVAQNPHSAILILSNEKFKYSCEHTDPMFREAWFAGPTESAFAYFHKPFQLYRVCEKSKFHSVLHQDKWVSKKKGKSLDWKVKQCNDGFYKN